MGCLPASTPNVSRGQGGNLVITKQVSVPAFDLVRHESEFSLEVVCPLHLAFTGNSWIDIHRFAFIIDAFDNTSLCIHPCQFPEGANVALPVLLHAGLVVNLFKERCQGQSAIRNHPQSFRVKGWRPFTSLVDVRLDPPIGVFSTT